jgi:hypothetical protein
VEKMAVAMVWSKVDKMDELKDYIMVAQRDENLVSIMAVY